MKKYLPLFFIFAFSLVFYLPIFNNPNVLTNRGNDLAEFFYPIFYFVRDSIYKYHQLPFWNNLFFSGTPLLPDPQAPIFYLPNLIFFLFKSIDTGFLISIFLHIFIGGVGMYHFAKKGFNFSKTASLFCAFLYISSPKLSGHVEAGHYGLITSWGWLPFVFLFTILLARKASFKRISLLSFFLALVFYSHILTFGITVICVVLLYFYLTKNPVPLIISGLICFGLIAVSFIPQLSWQSQTTRNLLLKNPDSYPQWFGFNEFISASVSPILMGYKFIWDLDTEKTIGLGIITLLFSFFGFLRVKKHLKIIFSIIVFTVFLISLNNISPIYSLLITEKWYILLRVSTRFWFLIVFIVIILAGYGLDFLLKREVIGFLIIVVAILAVTELILSSWTKIYKPIQQDNSLVSKELYGFLFQDKSQFRIFCLERCLSQKESAVYGLELVEGYGTLQQMNYYIHSEQLSQAFYRNRYTLSIPPFEIFEYEKLQPYTPDLASYNVKYVISDHLLTDKNLKFVKQFGKYLVYENEINLLRSNYPISFYSPNLIKIDTSKFITTNVILSEVYNSDWRAYGNNGKELHIFATPDQTRGVKINKDIKYVEFIYQPKSFVFGSVITITTIEALIVFFLYRKYRFFIKRNLF